MTANYYLWYIQALNYRENQLNDKDLEDDMLTRNNRYYFAICLNNEYIQFFSKIEAVLEYLQELKYSGIKNLSLARVPTQVTKLKVGIDKDLILKYSQKQYGGEYFDIIENFKVSSDFKMAGFDEFLKMYDLYQRLNKQKLKEFIFARNLKVSFNWFTSYESLFYKILDELKKVYI